MQDMRAARPPQNFFFHSDKKDTYSIFKKATQYTFFHNFISLGSYNINILHKVCAKTETSAPGSRHAATVTTNKSAILWHARCNEGKQ